MRVWGWVIIGMTLSGAAFAEPGGSGLAGLDAQLKTTGRVGDLVPRSTAQIEAASPDGGVAARTPTLPAPSLDAEGQARAASEPPGLAEEEYRRTDGPVTACRVEIARRRRIAPVKVAARTVTVRFTIEPDGRVRDAEALAAAGTDLEVAACAKRVVSEWVFAKHAQGPIVVQRRYLF
jgi:hypothetical protein